MRPRRVARLAVVAALLVPLAAASPAAGAAATTAGPAAGPAPDPPVAVDLGTLGGPGTVPVAVNDHGQVVGRSQVADGTWHAFLWGDGALTDLGTGRGTAVDVDERGRVLVQRQDADGAVVESLLWHRGRTVTLGAVTGEVLDGRGRVAGTVLVPDGDDVRTTPFRWARGVRTDMPAIPGFEGRSARVVDLNRRGVVLGMGLGPDGFERGFVWDGRTTTPIGVPSGLGGNGVVDLDDRGRVLGAEVGLGAFRWDGGVVTVLAGFADPELTDPVALDDRGDVAGTVLFAVDGRLHRAFVWRGGEVTLITAPSTAPGDAHTRAVDLDERGRLLGRVEPADPADPDAPRPPAAGAAFVWWRGAVTVLAPPAGTSADVDVRPVAISDRAGHVVGTATDVAGRERGLHWTVG